MADSLTPRPHRSTVTNCIRARVDQRLRLQLEVETAGRSRALAAPADGEPSGEAADLSAARGDSSVPASAYVDVGLDAACRRAAPRRDPWPLGSTEVATVGPAARPHLEVGVGDEPHGGSVGGVDLHDADESGAVDHRHADLDPVVGALADVDGVGEVRRRPDTTAAVVDRRRPPTRGLLARESSSSCSAASSSEASLALELVDPLLQALVLALQVAVVGDPVPGVREGSSAVRRALTGSKTVPASSRARSTTGASRKSRVSRAIEVRTSNTRVRRERPVRGATGYPQRRTATSAQIQWFCEENSTPFSASNSSSDWPEPMATAWSGSGAITIGMPVSWWSRASRP